MFAITQKEPGVSPLGLGTAPKPTPGAEQILVRVKATALNRADLLQRRGKYPPPPGESSILGLEIAGEVAEIGENVQGFNIGQRVFGLVGGGAYAQYCLIDAGCAMSIPDNLNFIEAAAIAEAFLTASEAIFTLGQLQKGDSILIHAGASGVGTAAIQLAHSRGAKIFTTVSTPTKMAKVIELGAKNAINYKEQDFEQVLRSLEAPGVNIIVDFIGAKYLMPNLRSLTIGGRLVCVGLMGGKTAEIDLDLLQKNRLQVKGLIMRRRSLEDKRQITRQFCEYGLPLLKTGQLKPVIDSIYPLQDAQKAHEKMETNSNIGKIILRMD